MQGAASDIDDEERRVRESDGKEVDMLMKNNIEGIIIKWAHQVFVQFGFILESNFSRGGRSSQHGV